VLNDNELAPADKPEVTAPVNVNAGAAVVPAGNCKVPVIISPALSTFNDAAPVKLAVIVPAEKLPELSRATIAFAVLALVAVVAELATFPAVEIVANLVSTIPADGLTSAFTINELDKLPDASLCTTPALVNASIEIVPPDAIFKRSNAEVLNDNAPALADKPVVVLPVNTNDGNAVVPAGNCNVPVMVSPAFNTLADAAPVKLAVIVPAEKLPELSRATIALAVLLLVAVVAELATLPAVEMVANLVSTIAAAGSTSAFTINELDNSPAELLCTTPAVVNASMVTPDALMFICSAPLISNDNTFAVAADKPVLVLPVNLSDGAAAVPAGNCNAPVIVSPALSTFNDAAPVTLPVTFPVKLAVMVPAEKLPEASRATMAFAELVLVAVVAEFATLPAVLIVANLVSTIAAAASTSALTINELDKLPEASLCTTPAVVNASIETVPPAAIFKRSSAFVLNDNAPALADKPVVVLPVNTNDGNAVVPAGNCNVPVMVSPAFNTLADAAPVKLAVMVPAEKLPELSRATIALAVLLLVAVVAEFATLPAVLIVANLVSTIAADGDTSALTINELDNNPVASL